MRAAAIYLLGAAQRIENTQVLLTPGVQHHGQTVKSLLLEAAGDNATIFELAHP
jgi:hypothetical protein